MLGLKAYEKKGVVRWERTELKNEIEAPNLDSMTKPRMFLLYRKLVVWLRVASRFVKQGFQGNARESLACPVATTKMKDISARLNSDDPVKGL